MIICIQTTKQLIPSRNEIKKKRNPVSSVKSRKCKLMTDAWRVTKEFLLLREREFFHVLHKAMKKLIENLLYLLLLVVTKQKQWQAFCLFTWWLFPPFPSIAKFIFPMMLKTATDGCQKHKSLTQPHERSTTKMLIRGYCFIIPILLSIILFAVHVKIVLAKFQLKCYIMKCWLYWGYFALKTTL